MQLENTNRKRIKFQLQLILLNSLHQQMLARQSHRFAFKLLDLVQDF